MYTLFCQYDGSEDDWIFVFTIEIIPSGCTDPEALNYNPDATLDDGSCYYGTTRVDCSGTVDSSTWSGSGGTDAYWKHFYGPNSNWYFWTSDYFETATWCEVVVPLTCFV